MLDKEITQLRDAANNTIQIWFENLEKIEAISLGIIGNKNFETLPDAVKDAVYLLDMHEIENLSLDDVRKVTATIEEYLNQP